MRREELASHIDHTILGPAVTSESVTEVVADALEHGMNACVPPAHVADVSEAYPDLTLVTVVDFPHGNAPPSVRQTAAEVAWHDGADEVDVVCPVGRLLSDDVSGLEADLAELVATVPIPVKLIVEAPLLSESQLRRVCEIAVEVDVDLLKTATGFAGGATTDDVAVMAEYLPVKASGGISSYDEAMAMLESGATRIGASSGVEILAGAPEE